MWGSDVPALHKALQIIRCDPSTATGFAPAELILGRKLYYPMDLDFQDDDFTGTELTNSVVQALNKVDEQNFGLASKKIGKHQKKYKAYYDRNRMKVGKHALKSKFDIKWKPRDSYYEIVAVNAKYHTAKLKTRKLDMSSKRASLSSSSENIDPETKLIYSVHNLTRKVRKIT